MDTLFISKVEMFPQAQLGTVEEAISYNRRGRVKFDGTYWPARFYDPDCKATVPPDELVSVVAIKGITLLVLPLERVAEDSWPTNLRAPETALTEADSGNPLYWDDRWAGER
jgi:hypothetical protein